MARRKPSNIVPSQNTILTITDIRGNVVLEVRDEESLVVNADGSITSYNRMSNIQLVDGSVWNRHMLLAKPPIYLGVCESCRHPGISLLKRRRPNHGLVAMHRAKLCSSCGTLCCPSDRKLSKRDKQWRCLSCHKKHVLGNLLLPIFYEKKGG